MTSLSSRLAAAIDARAHLVDERHETAFRLFNGFTEGLPTLALDVFATTLVVYDYAPGEAGDAGQVKAAVELARERLPWLEVALKKVRHSKNVSARNGTVVWGDEGKLARRIREDGAWYALNLTLNRDASFYIDTREVRAWLKRFCAGKRVLNTFAYSGSLSVAAMAGGATRVVSTDMNKEFLTVAKDSFSMNRWGVKKGDFPAGDFFDVVGRLRRDDELFDVVIVDPPFFSVTNQGRVDTEAEMARLLNKVRPLVGHDGVLLAINNAAFVSGEAYDAALSKVCADSYISLKERLPVPEDVTGYAATKEGALPADPTPYLHSTKVAVLAVTRKDGRRAGEAGKQAVVEEAAGDADDVSDVDDVSDAADTGAADDTESSAT